MQLNSISSINFESNGRYLSQRGRANAQQLLDKMSKSTTCKVNSSGTRRTYQIVSSLCLKDNIKFSDARLYIEQPEASEEAVKVPDCIMEIGKNTLSINSKTGEILKHKVGFFSSLGRVIYKAESSLKTLLDNFDNNWIVKKNTFEIVD